MSEARGYNIGVSCSQIVPLIVGNASDTVRLSDELLRRGFLIPAIRPPTVPQGTARLRISLMATHKEPDAESLVLAIEDVLGTGSTR